MTTITSPIITDETGKEIANAITSLAKSNRIRTDIISNLGNLPQAVAEQNL
jgi:hypothetical protein